MTMIRGTAIRNRCVLPDLPDETERRLVVELPTQFLGNRVTRRFYPEHYAKVQYARWVQEKYGRLNEAHGR